jgi:hypothetical protein
MKQDYCARGLKMCGHIFHPLWWTKCKVIKLRGYGRILSVAGRTVVKKHATVPEIHDEHHVQIENKYYPCIYLTVYFTTSINKI